MLRGGKSVSRYDFDRGKSAVDCQYGKIVADSLILAVVLAPAPRIHRVICGLFAIPNNRP